MIDWVNEVFDRVLVEQRASSRRTRRSSRPDSGLADETRSICVVRAEPADTADEARKNEASLIAGAIRRAVDEGWPVRDERTGEERPATFGDVAILFPTRTGIDLFETALRSQEIPYRVEGGRRSSRDRRCSTSRTCLRRSTTRSTRSRSSRPFARASSAAPTRRSTSTSSASASRLPLRDDRQPRVGPSAFAELLDLHRLRSRASLARLVRETVRRTRLIEIALTGWDGRQAAANIAKLVEQARAFSARGGGGLRAFARWLTDQRGTADTEDAGVAEVTDDVVRLVTMHASKGLEYPIVALANLGSRGEPHRAGRRPRATPPRAPDHALGKKQFETPGFDAAWTAEKAQLDAEELRLLYVAATRARDRLIVPVSKRGKDKTPKLDALTPSLPGPDDPLEAPDGGRVRSTRRSLRRRCPTSRRSPRSGRRGRRPRRSRSATRGSWPTSPRARRRARSLRVFPATRDEGDVDLSALMLAADDEPLIVGAGHPLPSARRCTASSS